MKQLEIKVLHEIGLHARPAALVVNQANRFNSTIQIRNRTTGSEWVDAKSILSVLGLGVEKDHEIELSAQGDDETQALEALAQLVNSLASLAA